MAGRLGVLVDLGPAGARTLAQRHGEVGRGDVAVVGVVQRADDRGRVGAAAELHQRPQLFDALRGDYLERHADGVGGTAVLLVLVHALPAGCEAQVAADVEADVLAGLLRQALVQVDRVLVQLADRVAHVEERQQPRGMPGGSGGELGALDERDVLPALLGQVVERADAHHAAADHQRPNVRFHGGSVERAVPGSDSNCDGGLLK